MSNYNYTDRSGGAQNQSYEQSEDQGHNFYRSEYQSQGGRSCRSKYTNTKTAGLVQLENLQQEDISKDQQFAQDEFNRLDLEIEQLEGNKVKNIHRAVESLVSGKFNRISKAFDPNKDLSMKKIIDLDGDGIVSTQELNDYEMKQQQKIWVNRINKIYNLTLGLLGGMSIMHLIMVTAHPDIDSFLNIYASFSNLILMITQILANFTLVFGLSLNMIYKNKSDEKMRNMDPHRDEFLQHYNLGVLTSVMVAVSWVILNLMPQQTNKFWYLDAATIKKQESDYTTFKIYTFISDAFLILSWIVASIYNKAAIEDIDLDPEDAGGEAHKEKHFDQNDEHDSDGEEDGPTA